MRHESFTCDFCGCDTPRNEIVELSLDAQAYLGSKSRHMVKLGLCIACGAEAALDLLSKAKAIDASIEAALLGVNEVICSEVAFQLTSLIRQEKDETK